MQNDTSSLRPNSLRLTFKVYGGEFEQVFKMEQVVENNANAI